MLFGLLTLVFFLSRLLPGDTASVFISPGVPPAIAEQLRSQFGLDRPLAGQYVSWLASVLRGDLGFSFSHSAPVTDVLFTVFPNTVVLGGAALLLEVVLAFVLVTVTASAIGSSFDRFLSNLTLVVYSLPSFWIGIVLLSLFSFQLGVFPSTQMHSVGMSDAGGWDAFIDLLRHLTLPALTVAIPGAASIARYLRTSIAKTLTQDFVLAAMGMGLPKTAVFRSYVVPNSMGPVVSVLGIEIGTLLTGVLVTETLFSWPGMGRIAVMAISARDYPLILGCTIVGGLVVVAANLAADMLNAWIDPRIRLA